MAKIAIIDYSTPKIVVYHNAPESVLTNEGAEEFLLQENFNLDETHYLTSSNEIEIEHLY